MPLITTMTTEDVFDPDTYIGGKAKAPRPPGPGTYNSHFYGSIAHRNKRGNGPTFTGRNFVPSMSDRREYGPGPAAYSPKKLSPAPSFTLKGKFNEPGAEENKVFPGPGPGEYNTAGDMSNCPTAASFKDRTKAFDPKYCLVPPGTEGIPGPGQYNPELLDTSRHPSIKMPLSTRMDNFPGPGTYTPRAPKNAPSFSLSSKLGANPLGSFVDSSLPGPGAYHIRSACFDNGEQSTHVTGPGKTFGWKVHTPTAPEGPGPGQYPLPSTRSTRKATVTGRWKSKEIDLSPGPGHYNAAENVQNGTAVSLKSRNIPVFHEERPGPGTYDTSPTFGKSGKAITLGQKLKHGSVFTVEVPKDAKEAKLWQEFEDNDPRGRVTFPGPGAYSPKISIEEKAKTSLGVSIGLPLKEHDATNPTGPGQYDLDTTIGKNATITMKPRFEKGGIFDQGQNRSFPGPGTYDMMDHKGVGKDSPTVVISSPRR